MQRRNRISGWSIGALVVVIAGVMFLGAVIAALLMTLVLGVRALTRQLRSTALGRPARQKKATFRVPRGHPEGDMAAAPQRAK